VLLEQGDRPVHGGIAQLLGRPAQEFAEQVPVLRLPEAGTAAACVIGQGLRLVGLGVGVDPVIDTARRHPQGLGDLGDGLAAADLQDRQGPAVQAGIAGGV
jgi:hypothetical protein